MRLRLIVLAVALAAGSVPSGGQTDVVARRIAIAWSGGRPQGSISVTGGTISNIRITGGKGTVEANSRFAAAQEGPLRLEVQLSGSEAQYGPGAAIVTVATARDPFSFFLRDVRTEYPIFIPQYGVTVTDAADSRCYDEIEASIRERGLQTDLEQIESEPEESFEGGGESTRKMVPNLAGLEPRHAHLRGGARGWTGFSRAFTAMRLKMPETGATSRSPAIS